MTKEDEKAIAISLIPQYVQKQKELKPQYEHIKQVGEELKQIKKDYNIADVKQAKPLQYTSFMTLTGNQLKEYELKTKVTREKRLFTNQIKTRGKRSPREIGMAHSTKNELETQGNEDYNNSQLKRFPKRLDEVP